MSKKYTFYSDPGHGWLAVPIEQLHELGIADKISPYSYKQDDTAYLEEDCDASLFCDAAVKAGLTVEFSYCNEPHKDSFVRSLNSYRF